DVLCYVAVDAFGILQSYSLFWSKRTKLSYGFRWKYASCGWLPYIDTSYTQATPLPRASTLRRHIIIAQLTRTAHSLVTVETVT
ncbi:hypothetical protein SFRURICE_008628, partial [Spodoptera frugiperda]